MSRLQLVIQSHNSVVAIKSFVNVANFKYLGTIVTNRNYIHE